MTEVFLIARVYDDMSKYIEIKSSSLLKMHLDLLRRPLREEARRLVTIALGNNAYRAGVRHLLADDSSAKLLGYSREDVLGKSVFDLYSPDTTAEIQAIEADLINNNRSVVQATYKVDRDDAPPVWMSVDKIANEHQGENKPTIYSVGVDISDVVKGTQDAEMLVRQ